jgi:DNA modification methylase
VKNKPTLVRKTFLNAHEWCFYGWREGASHYFHPLIRNAWDVWQIDKVDQRGAVHLTEKPVEITVRTLTYSSKAGENVLDIFGGSGSTMIGAEMTGRHAFLMEIDPYYCDIIVRRWQTFTGKTATLEGAEKTFAEVQAEREKVAS